MQDLALLQYPIGQFNPETQFTFDQTQGHIQAIDELPIKLTELVGKWGDDWLDTPYRPGGWTVRQVVHHVADSHINAYVRTKLALTEDNPTIKPYEQDQWITLPDVRLDVAPSLVLLRSLHQRWVVVLRSLREADFRRTYVHPESERIIPLSEVVAHYAWHGEHHYGHVYQLAARNSWL